MEFQASALKLQFLLKIVRVEAEHKDFLERYGYSGTVTAVNAEKQELQVVTSQHAWWIPVSLVKVRAERELDTREILSFQRVSQREKVNMLHQLGHWDANASAPIEQVSATSPLRLADAQISLWNLALARTFPKADYEYFEPQAFLRMLVGEFAEPERAEELEKGARQSFQRHELLLFPIHGEESPEHPLGHWTLLAVGKREDGQAAFRYYESLHTPNEICLSKALKIAAILSGAEDLPIQNAFRQKSDECAESVCHYMAIEVRHLAGEGWGSVKPLHPVHRKVIRNNLSRFAKNLEEARLKWVHEELQAEVKAKALHQFVERKVGKARMAELELSKLRAVAISVGKLQDLHQDLPNLELPKVETKAKSKVKGKSKAKSKSKAKPKAKSKAAEVSEPDAVELDLSEPQPEEAVEEIEALVAAAEEDHENQDEQVEVPSDEEEDAELQQKLEELSAGVENFEKWLKALKPEHLSGLVALHFENRPEKDEVERYLQHVSLTETIQGCGKCRYTRCEVCNLQQAQRYVLRHGKVASWWKRRFR